MDNIEVYTINNCGYCEAAKSLLNNYALSFNEINISTDDQKKLELVKKTGHRTLPQIFINGHFVGGFKELKQYLSNHA